MIWLLLAAALPCVAIYFVLRSWTAPVFGALLCAALACAFGTAASSLLWWGLLHLPLATAGARAAVDLGMWIVVGGGAFWIHRSRRATGLLLPIAAARASRTRVWHVATAAWAAVLLLAVGGVACVAFVSSNVAAPHGEWDAWMIWNMRARDLYRSDPGAWRDAFTLATHADYPLLAPLSVARGWVWLGRDSPVVPIAFAAFSGGLVALVAGLSIARRSGAARGLLTAAMILATPSFVEWWPLQGTDIATSLYLLVTLVLVAAAREPGAPVGLWALAGAAAACAAWTKNEGIAFCALVGLVLILTAIVDRSWRHRWRAVGVLALGAVPILAVVAAFKWSIPIPNDLVGSQSIGRTVRLLGDAARIKQVATAFAHELWTTGATTIGTLPVMAAFVAIGGIDARRIRAALPIIGVIVAMAGLDMAVYVLTPLNLTRHLQSSLDRVVLQLVPSTIWVGMWLTGSGSSEARHDDRAEAAGAPQNLGT